MGHTFSANIFHVVFATKHRDNAILNPDELWAYTAGIMRNIGAESISIGGTQNHVHLLLRLPPHIAVAQAAQKIKANSSRWLRESGRWEGWQEGYGSFSVGISSLGAVCRYIRNQPRHHAKQSFEDEFMALLTRGRIVFDPSTVFE
ncbi:MAG: IS200/IS605 family transposase [Candidatus Korobacteraceae bacterium]